MTRQTILPALLHRDARKAIGLLGRASGARPHAVYDAEDGSVACGARPHAVYDAEDGSVARAEAEGRG